MEIDDGFIGNCILVPFAIGAGILFAAAPIAGAIWLIKAVL